MNRDARGLLVAVAAAFGAGLLAISEHAERVEQGYRLAAARAEGEVLRREAMHAERRVALLSLPKVATERAVAMKLDLGHPPDRRTLSPEQVTALMAPPSAEEPAAPSAAPPTSPVAPGIRPSLPAARIPRPGEMAR